MKLYFKKKEWKKLDKGFKVGLNIGVLVGGIFMILGIVSLLFIFVGTIDFGQGNFALKFLDNQQENAYERVAGYWQESEFVKSLGYICSFQKTEKQKVECIYYYVNNLFNYTNHGLGNQLRGSPEEIISKGGVCRDFVSLYSSILKNLNISYEFISVPNHVYLMVYPKDYDCKLDMDYLNCIEK